MEGMQRARPAGLPLERIVRAVQHTMQNDHPQESIPAYVLGALAADESLRLRAHLDVCEACRAEVASFYASVTLPPHTVPGQDPPGRVRQRLLARIADSLSLK